MHHHRGVDTVECAGADHQFLAAAFFFRGRSQQANRAAQPVAHCIERKRRAERGRGDQIVSARVADAGQRVVLGQQSHPRARCGAFEFALESGFEAVCRPPHRQSRRGQRVAQQAARMVFIEREFRMRVDVVRDVEQLRGHRVDPVHHDLLQLFRHIGLRTRVACGHDCRFGFDVTSAISRPNFKR